MIEKLASAQGSKAETINVELATAMAEAEDSGGISVLVTHLIDKDKAVANDCIKVLYEIGKIKPSLIADYFDVFISLLKSKNNRMIWGAMMAISQIAPLCAEKTDRHFEDIVFAYESGSVITIDYAISVFAEIVKSETENSPAAFEMIIHHLSNCRPKEIPQHAERSFICINEKNSPAFRDVLNKRMNIMTDSQKKRVKRLIKKIEKNDFLA